MQRRKFKESLIPSRLRLHVRYERGARWITYARLHDEHDAVLATGKAVCSRNDNPNRKIGRAIAVGRCLKQYWNNERRGR